VTAPIDITGQRFGRLTVLRRAENTPTGRARWACACACGGSAVVCRDELRSGHVRSCGCIQGERHRGVRAPDGHISRTYSTWQLMIKRCMSATCREFDQYGARGITVCERWRDFQRFLDDMGERPPGTTIDRIDGTRGYEPGNCRWATPKEQGRNRKTNRPVTYAGRTMPVSAWAEELGLNRNVLLQRLNKGWSIADALNRPLSSRREAAMSRWRGRKTACNQGT
jgi:hypothetical protein